jgi:hypothetical protein
VKTILDEAVSKLEALFDEWRAIGAPRCGPE